MVAVVIITVHWTDSSFPLMPSPYRSKRDLACPSSQELPVYCIPTQSTTRSHSLLETSHGRNIYTMKIGKTGIKKKADHLFPGELVVKHLPPHHLYSLASPLSTTHSPLQKKKKIMEDLLCAVHLKVCRGAARLASLQ